MAVLPDETTLEMDCPVCGRGLRVPIRVRDEGPVDGRPEVAVVIDDAYLRAHALTHGFYDGTPLELVA